MPPNKLENSSQPTHPVAALAACEDLMLCVLARLPVKSIIRFKSVCKSWNHLLSTQEFIKLQYKISTESKNQSFLVHNMNGNNELISVFNIESDKKKAKILDHPFDKTQVRIDIVGCCRGLVCIKRGQEFILWNPAMNLFKTVSPLKDHNSVRLGFGYDAEGDDFKVVRIVLKYKRNFGICVSCVEVYSVNSDSWTTIDPSFQFSKLKIDRNSISGIVNGNPYWVGKIDVIEKDVLICFDMSKLVFKIVSLSLGALVFTCRYDMIENVDMITYGDRIEYVYAWVFDEGEQIRTKSHSFGMGTIRVLRCLKDGRVLGLHPSGQLIVFKSETRLLKGLFNVGYYFDIFYYTASLTYIQGMEKVKLKKRRDLWNKSKVLGVCFFSIMFIVSNLKFFSSSRTGNKH